MEVKIFDDDKNWLKSSYSQSETMKFVMILDIRNETVAQIFPANFTHSSQASRLVYFNEGSQFLGAGIINNATFTYGSETCEDLYGADTPKENAAALIEELRAVVLKIVSES